jgi:hypothetical protein
MAGSRNYIRSQLLSLSHYQDMQCVENCDDPDPRGRVLYEQPVWQTLQMFRPYSSIPLRLYKSNPSELVGEMLC